MKTVYELFMQRFINQQNKHELHPNWAIEEIKHMTRDEFLMELSDAIELRLMKHERKVEEK